MICNKPDKLCCPVCKATLGVVSAYHEYGCGYCNTQKQDTPHTHYFCNRCHIDWIPKDDKRKAV